MSKFCGACGAPIADGIKFCRACGASTQPPASTSPQAEFRPVAKPEAPIAVP